ncbi:hypothetical protein CR513_28152, partial [Mucuna pruriens]
MVNEVGMINNSRLENQLTELTSLVKELVIGQHQPIAVVKACGICTSVEHPIDMCSILQEIEPDHPESVGSIGECRLALGKDWSDMDSTKPYLTRSRLSAKD